MRVFDRPSGSSSDLPQRRSACLSNVDDHEDAGKGEQLLAALDELLGPAMGVPFARHYYQWITDEKLPLAFAWATIYFGVFCLAFGLDSYGEHRVDARFTGLLAWGWLFSSAIMLFAREATVRVRDIVSRDILPYASNEYIRSVSEDLERANSRRVRFAVPLASTIVVMVITAVVTTNYEKPPILDYGFSFQSPLWDVIASFLCFTSVRGLLVGRFYEPFAKALAKHPGHLFVFGAAETPLIRGVGSLGHRMIAFWATMFLCFLPIMMLSLNGLRPYSFGGHSPFLDIVVPLAGVISLGYGSLGSGLISATR